MPRRIDTGVFEKIQSFDDYRKANEEFQRKRALEQQDATIKRQAFDLEAQKFEDERRATQEALRSGRMTGNSFQAQLWNQMDAQGYTPQQRIEALTMKGIPLQDGGYATYSPSNIVGAPGAVGGMTTSNPAPVQTSELPASGGAPFNDILASLQGQQTGMDGQAPASAPVPNPPTPQQMANQAQSRFGGIDVLVQPGMKQADAMAAMASANKAESQAVNSIGLIDKLIDERGNLRPEAASVVGPIQGRTVANMPMTRNQTYAQPIIDQLRGQAFLQAFEGLKGGGAITEIEGQKAEQAIARLSQTQYEPDFAQALKELRDIMAVGMERARQQRGQINIANPVQNQMSAAPQNVQQQPASNADLLQYMTPEERALFQ